MNRHVRAVTRGKDGALWVGTGDGLFRFIHKQWTRFDRRHGLPSPQITALHNDPDGTIWIATQEGVARLIDERIAAVPELAALRVHSMTTDHRGDLWLNDVENGLFRVHRHDRSVERIAGVDAPFSAYTDKDGRVWIGTFTGTVYVFEDHTSRSYTESDGLSGGSITSLFQDRNGAMWVGSVGGLSRFLTDRFVTLTERHGLPGGIVEAIIDDDKGCLWLGLNTGIARLPMRELEQAVSAPAHRMEYSLYDSSDGLRGTPIGLGQPIVARTSDNSLWFTTSDGLASIDPARADRNRLPPPVHIESVLADGRAFVQDGDLDLPARTANLQIDYTALSFVAPSQIRFRYMLEGFDADWVDAGTRRRAFYTNLPPRRYRFRVAANNGGVWSQGDAQQDFFIRPTVYQRPAFFALCVAAGIVLIALAWQMRVRQVRRSFALVLSERTRMGREIHDTVLQSLVGLALQLDAAARDPDGSSPKTTRLFERLRREVQVNIREARQSILDLRSPMFERKDLATALQEIGRRIAKGKAQFTFVLTGVPRSVLPRIEEQLLRIGQEAITNAVRHAHANQITVELEFGEAKVVLRVIDDGVGFDLSNVADQFQSHWGLANMQERTQLIGGEFRLITAPGHGTEIHAVGPL
jgi:signal transduction histidine kinase/streptogramin lyase